MVLVSMKILLICCDRSIYETPIIIAPSAFHRLAHPDGEAATSRGATEAECIYSYNWLYSTMTEPEVLQSTGKWSNELYSFYN